MAPTEVYMGSKRQYTDEFRNEMVKQMTNYDFAVIDATTQAVVPKYTLYECALNAQ